MVQLQSSRFTRTLIAGLLVVGTFSCSRNTANPPSTQSASSPNPAPAAVTANPLKVAPTPQPDTYQPALDKAESAQSIARLAQSKDDWLLVADRWQQAIELMQVVPPASPHTKQAKAKLAEFKRNLANAKKQAVAQAKQAEATLSSTATTTNSSTAGGGIFSSASSCSYIEQQIAQVRNAAQQKQNSYARNEQIGRELSNLYNQYYRYCANRPYRR